MSMTRLMEESEMSRVLERLAAQLHERHDRCDSVMLIGIERRGVHIARRLAQRLKDRLGETVDLGTLDINLYRDDWTRLAGKPRIGQSHIPQSVNDRTIVLVDDVLYTGRTIRAALEALLDYGRPQAVELLVLIDRGHRELPIQPDYVGRVMHTSRQEHVDVLLKEHDGEDAVLLRGAS
ncbi:MAG: bifunctional pyr operon transcriptional regulator/uracil phosphoribosyltransferase PyrR [Desulfovibrio sp.]|nr:bifunctional pyr operon transcriptional regulator/uracil phosphoribosyltransferase PyrR [Desulfovibrio sp.]